MNQGISIKRGVLLLALGALVAVGAGCGGGDDDGDTGAAANSQSSSQAASQGGSNEAAEGNGKEGGSGSGGESSESSPMLAEADSICTEMGQEYRDAIQPYLESEVNGQKDEEEFYEGIVEQVAVPAIEERVDVLQDLSGSESEEEVIDEMTAKLEAMADEAEAEPTVFGGGTLPAVVDARETAKKLGVKNCGLAP